MKFGSLGSDVNIAMAALMVFSLFGFIGNVMLDYNWGTNIVTNSIAIAYSLTLRRAVPFPVNYYGAGTGAYFSLFLLSFLVLNRRERIRRNIVETLSLACAALVLFELGLMYFVPGFMDTWVIAALSTTPLRLFTNWDLMALAIGVLGLSQVLLLHMKTTRQ